MFTACPVMPPSFSDAMRSEREATSSDAIRRFCGELAANRGQNFTDALAGFFGHHSGVLSRPLVVDVTGADGVHRDAVARHLVSYRSELLRVTRDNNDAATPLGKGFGQRATQAAAAACNQNNFVFYPAHRAKSTTSLGLKRKPATTRTLVL